MNIKTRLEDDRVLFLSFLNNTSRSNILKDFNKKGIFTVEDFINADTKIFNNASRNIYTAMIHVFRYAYLNEPLVYDVLLQKKYSNHDLEGMEIVKDFIRLGLCRNDRYLAGSIISEIVSNYSGEVLTMEYILKNIKPSTHGPNLKSFYINYLEKMKDVNYFKNNEEIFLSELKAELQTLINMRQELDQKIDVLQEKISNYDEGSIKHGRK